MATATEIQSLNDINYKSKVKLFLFIFLGFFLFNFGFLNFYPIGDKIKTVIKSSLNGQGCTPDFDQISFEFFMPKIIVSNLSIPASCMEKSGEPFKFNYVTLNWHLINFVPFGLPFRLDTEFQGQPLTVYYVIGFNKHLIRMKDQSLVLARLAPLLGEGVKVGGNVVVDLNVSLVNNSLSTLSLKAQSKNLQFPSQSIQGFTTPSLKLNEFYLEANSSAPPRITVDKLFLGDMESPIRAKFKGTIDLVEGNAAFSPLNLTGEVAFSKQLSESLPLIDMMFQTFTQKDGFYQIGVGGNLGAPKPIAN
jgi:hypothetical protein